MEPYERHFFFLGFLPLSILAPHAFSIAEIIPAEYLAVPFSMSTISEVFTLTSFASWVWVKFFPNLACWTDDAHVWLTVSYLISSSPL